MKEVNMWNVIIIKNIYIWELLIAILCIWEEVNWYIQISCVTLTLKYGIKVLDINKWKVSIKFTGVIIQAEKRDLGGICSEK